MKLVTTEFKSGGLHEKHVVALFLIFTCLAVATGPFEFTSRHFSTFRIVVSFVTNVTNSRKLCSLPPIFLMFVGPCIFVIVEE
jgi:hypothetical protein